MKIDLDQLSSLLPKYDLTAPRYTSYPTVPVWNESYPEGRFEAALKTVDAKSAGGLALYVHVPFCRALCHYCACNRVITQDESLPERYLSVLATEIAAVRSRLDGAPRANEVHLGGGTPTHLSPAQLTELMNLLTQSFPLTQDAELSVEVDPRVTTKDHLSALRAFGFNRISLGVQDFEPAVQRAIHRVQPYEMVTELTEHCRESGFESINFDLIYGLPFQTIETLDRTLDKVFELKPDRVALYSYAHVTWVAKQQRGFERLDLPSHNEKIEILLHAIRRFVTEDYVHIGMDHFARSSDALTRAAESGDLRRNFMGYTTALSEDVIGFGPSAISQCGRDYAQAFRGLDEWETAVKRGDLAICKGHTLSDEDLRRRFVISQIMCSGRVEGSDYEQEFGRKMIDDFPREFVDLAEAERDGLVVFESDDRFAATAVGKLLLRNLATIFDAHLPGQRDLGKPLFSRAL